MGPVDYILFTSPVIVVAILFVIVGWLERKHRRELGQSNPGRG